MGHDPKLKMLFRADASPPIGTGDLVSCIHLAGLLKDRGWECHFMVKETESAKSILKSRNEEHVCYIPCDASIRDEARFIKKYARNMDAVLFEITAHKLLEYDLDGIHCVKCAVDFYNWIPKDLDLVINWDTRAKELYDRNKFPNTSFFLGPQYVLLEKRFLKLNAAQRSWPPKKILITMGGADEHNLTCRILKEVDLNRASFRVVLGAGFEHLEELARLGKDFTVLKNIKNMHSEYLNCDYAYGAGGLTAYELMATHTPCTLIACYKHQIHRCEYFASKGWAHYHGYREEEKKIRFPKALEGEGPCYESRVHEVIEKLENLVHGKKTNPCYSRPS